MERQASSTVTAAELVRSFAQCREVASLRPLNITNHGRTTHVLLSSALYEQLRQTSVGAGKADPAAHAHDEIRDLADWLDDAMIVCSRDYTIQFANRVAHALCHQPSGALAGKPLFEALPEITGTLLEVHFQRTVISYEPSAADMPSPFAPDAWLRVQTFPIGDRVVVVFRDITDDVNRHRLADVKNALLNAMNVHGGIAYIRLSVRGTVLRVDKPFCDMLDLKEERLRDIQLTDLVATSHKARFRQELDSVLRGEGDRRIVLKFLSNRGTEVQMAGAMTQLHGAYGGEGAIIVLTPTESDPA